MYKLSIITVNYNNLEGLKRTVESVVNQTWQEFEYIVIDGGSTDGSAEYIESKSEQVDYWVSEPDNGIYNAMNKGIAVATGEYLLFLNSGDKLVNSNMLDELIKLINSFRGSIDIFYGSVFWQHLNQRWTPPRKLKFKNFFMNVPIPHQATIYRRIMFEKFKYNLDLEIVGDWAFFLDSFIRRKCSVFRLDIIVSICEKPGLSELNLNKNKSEIRKYLIFNYPFRYLVHSFIRIKWK